MGHSRKRPITGQTANGTGATYIVVESFEDTVNIQASINGTVTYTVDWTNMNILYDATALAAVNVVQPDDAPRYVAPASADWVNFIASGSVDANGQLQFPVFAVRINITAGTGSVSYYITQG